MKNVAKCLFLLEINCHHLHSEPLILAIPNLSTTSFIFSLPSVLDAHRLAHSGWGPC